MSLLPDNAIAVAGSSCCLNNNLTQEDRQAHGYCPPQLADTIMRTCFRRLEEFCPAGPTSNPARLVTITIVLKGSGRAGQLCELLSRPWRCSMAMGFKTGLHFAKCSLRCYISLIQGALALHCLEILYFFFQAPQLMLAA